MLNEPNSLNQKTASKYGCGLLGYNLAILYLFVLIPATAKTNQGVIQELKKTHVESGADSFTHLTFLF